MYNLKSISPQRSKLCLNTCLINVLNANFKLKKNTSITTAIELLNVVF